MRRREFVGTLGSAAIALPLAARAQQRPVPVIGFLGVASPGPSAQYVAAFHQGLSETGYVEGQNVTTEYRWAEDSYDRLPRLAADLVDHKVDVILATGGTAGAMAAKSATSTIPIVFTSGDAIADRLVDNLTGVSILAVELIPKRVELMSELAPGTRVIALVVNPNNPNAERVMRDAHEAARAKGMQLHVLKAGSEPDFEPALASVTQLQASALLIQSDPFFTIRREQLIALAARHTIPAIYQGREFVVSGGLISYGPSLTGIYRQLGIYTGRILHGKKPAELPVEQPTKYELVINLNTAKALGLTVPRSLLARADEIIE
jgi:putative tryptophan/tyrosine transport system substrate-binding protein